MPTSRPRLGTNATRWYRDEFAPMTEPKQLKKGCAFFFILFPIPFAAIGIGILIWALRKLLSGNYKWDELLFLFPFGMVFALAGLGLMAGIIYARRQSRKEDNRQECHPNEPWLWKEEWASRRIPSSRDSLGWGLGIMAVFWNLLLIPLVPMLLREFEKKRDWRILIATLFPIIGVALLAAAARSAIRSLKYRRAFFEMNSACGVIGGKLAGVIHLSSPILAGGPGVIRLSCVEKDSRGDNSSTSILWQDEKVVGDQHFRFGYLPVDFTVPYSCRESSRGSASVTIHWTLTVTAPTAGVDFRAEFEVPVFTTESSDPAISEEAAAREQRIQSGVRYPRSRGIRVVPTPVGAEFFFGPARNIGSALVATLVAAVWGGLTFVLFRVGAPAPVVVFLGVIEVLILYGVLRSWLGTDWVAVNRMEVRWKRGLLGAGRVRYVAVEDMRDFKCQIGMTTQETPYHSIYAVLRQKYRFAKHLKALVKDAPAVDRLPLFKRIAVASHIRDKGEALWLAEEMRRYAGLRPVP
jgi:hypothetical protein